MKKSTPTPKQAFFEGHNARSAHPLHKGVYKLRESKWKLERALRDVTTITRYKTNNWQLPYAMESCMGDEAASWLKAVPTIITRTLGYEILPALRALTGDGLSSQEITRLKSDLKPKVGSLLVDCEWTHHIIRKNIRHEYNNMKKNQSELAQELKDAIWLCDMALDLHEVSQKSAETAC